MEIFKPKKLYCDVGNTEAIINIEGGELVDNAKGYVDSVCSGCEYWTEEKIRQADSQLEQELGPGHVNQESINMFEQHLVDQSRFVQGDERKIVVAMCSAWGRKFSIEKE